MSAVHVPEHSRPLLEAISSGRSFEKDGYVFVAADDWLMAIGYCLEGEESPQRFEKVLEEVIREKKPSDCFAIAPEMPGSLKEYVQDRDVYYVLAADAPVPARLRGPVRHARECLTVDETRFFTPEHRRLWAEFLGRIPLPPRIRQLYSGTASALARGADLRLLNAWDAEGQLAACLLLDYSLPDCVSYVLGAHSKTHYVPHAPDLLFAEMLERARAEGKRSVLLGLGVNEGITRFKRKWGGVQDVPYELAVWQPAAARGESVLSDMASMLAMNIASSSGGEVSRWKFFDSLPRQRPCAMLWRLDKNGRTSWIGGSAHFFCCSFEYSLRRLFENVDTVLLEGPIDSESMDEVARIGRTPEPDADRVIRHLSEEDIRRLERTVYGPEGFWARLGGWCRPRTLDVRRVLAESRQWYAFFSLWTAYLERHGWTNSVDLEVWNTALDMGKSVMGMESLAEQIASLESAPMPRIVKFMKDCSFWPKLMKSNCSRYLAGDLMGMMGTSAEFPTRTGTIISVRDQRFRERMRPYIERGGTAVFVGSAHMINLRNMLAEDGFTVTRVLPTWKHRFSAWIRRDDTVVLPGNPDAPVWEKAPENVRSHALQSSVSHAGKVQAAAHGPSSGRALADLGARALVPEQIPSYVRAVSGRRLQSCEGFAAWTTADSCTLVAFPAEDELASCPLDSEAYALRLEKAVSSALAMPGLRRITVLAPLIPAAAPAQAVVERDAWWCVKLPHTPAQKLRNMLRRACREATLSVEEWGPEHDALVDHYLKVRTLAPGTRHIFGRVGRYVQSSPEALLFAARDASGRLLAMAVGDYSALSTAFYMFAFRQDDCPPGVSDALLRALADEAERRGQSTLNLGLGIDGGITFFKKKWGAFLAMPHLETSWTV
ncbi:GNAT family N-acetyltransferase [uncultured Mailhella sp.]|uniref:TraB/GumN family protein n=1 Tax=uncultured Mailhella sp. TaxID=1981031 RepID=UPI0025CE58A2|nr:GNAT family N-acetyltransferase [uncultured Mailhella sp.]